MSDEDALLAAIDAHPAEDTPRLAFADWCDENDRPLRAEFIRLQIALTDVESLTADQQRHAVRRCHELIQNHFPDVLPGSFGAEMPLREVTFERGFASEVRVTALQFVLNPGAVADLRPRPRVSARNLNSTNARRFVQLTEVGCVTSLAANYPGPGASPALVACPHLTRLEVLDWSLCGNEHGLGNAGLEGLAFADRFPALTTLNITNNDIGDGGVARLVASPLWQRLRTLMLDHNPITDAGADALTNAPENGLEHLALRGVQIGHAARRRLVRRYGDRLAI